MTDRAFTVSLFVTGVLTREEAERLAKRLEGLFGRPAEWILKDIITGCTYHVTDSAQAEMPDDLRDLLDLLCVSYIWEVRSSDDWIKDPAGDDLKMKPIRMEIRDHARGQHLRSAVVYPRDPSTGYRALFAGFEVISVNDAPPNRDAAELVRVWEEKLRKFDGEIIIPQSNHDILSLSQKPDHAVPAQALLSRRAQVS